MSPEQELVQDWRSQLVEALGIYPPTSINWQRVHEILDHMEEYVLSK